MLIQIWHSKESNFVEELYLPIMKSNLSINNDIIFPHDDKIIDSRKTLKDVDLFIAEVTKSATWLWIELWFASIYWKRIIAIHKKWTKISSSIKYVTDEFIEYSDKEEMIEKLEKIITTTRVFNPL